MKKSSIILITVLMSIALAGLAVFQVLHIRELFSVRQKQFDASVMQSLHETAASLENREAAKLITSNLFSIQLDSMLSSKYVLHDSLNTLLTTINLPRKKTASAHKFKYEIHTDSLGSSHYFEFGDEVIREKVAGEKALEQHQAMVEMQLEDFHDRLSNKEKQISVVMKKMEKEAMLAAGNIRSRVDIRQVEKVLSASLQNRGIKTPFSYAVLSQKDSVVFSNDSNAIDKVKASVYTTQLFPNDIIPGNNFLNVWFPQKSMLLFSVSDFNLFSSFIFIIIIMLCFAYTMVTLVRQKKLSDMKSDFINNMTHELKTPIATISVATDALRDTASVTDETQIKYYSGIIRQENERMNAQVERVLQLARLDKREMQLNKESVNIHELVYNAVTTFRMQVEKSNGVLTEELTAEQPVISVDALHISNIIHNLLDNAKKYSADKPDIKIKTWNGAKGIFISVSDRGIGMSKETLKKIFDKFFRASKGNIHDVKGFGIGLSYVKEIVELHGGKILAESQPGEGSIFTVFLPYE